MSDPLDEPIDAEHPRKPPRKPRRNKKTEPVLKTPLPKVVTVEKEVPRLPRFCYLVVVANTSQSQSCDTMFEAMMVARDIPPHEKVVIHFNAPRVDGLHQRNSGESVFYTRVVSSDQRVIAWVISTGYDGKLPQDVGLYEDRRAQKIRDAFKQQQRVQYARQRWRDECAKRGGK